VALSNDLRELVLAVRGSQGVFSGSEFPKRTSFTNFAPSHRAHSCAKILFAVRKGRERAVLGLFTTELLFRGYTERRMGCDYRKIAPQG
jgi:hypothetical protein